MQDPAQLLGEAARLAQGAVDKLGSAFDSIASGLDDFASKFTSLGSFLEEALTYAVQGLESLAKDALKPLLEDDLFKAIAMVGAVLVSVITQNPAPIYWTLEAMGASTAFATLSGRNDDLPPVLFGGEF